MCQNVAESGTNMCQNMCLKPPPGLPPGGVFYPSITHPAKRPERPRGFRGAWRKGSEKSLYFPEATFYSFVQRQIIFHKAPHVAFSPSFFRHDLTPSAVGLDVPVTVGGVVRTLLPPPFSDGQLPIAFPVWFHAGFFCVRGVFRLTAATPRPARAAGAMSVNS